MRFDRHFFLGQQKGIIFFDLVSMALGIAAVCLKERCINLCEERERKVLGQLVKMAYAVITTHTL